jgi:DNA repair exonuclease SbcCD nuclease subunit
MKQPTVFFTDLHINRYTQFSQHHDRLKDCLKVIDDVFKYAIHYEANTILFGGDLGDLPKWVYVDVIDALMGRFVKWFTKCPHITLYAISGNHDHSTKNYFDKPAKTFLGVFVKAFPGNFILLDNDFNGCVMGIPYYEHKTCFDTALEDMHSRAVAIKKKQGTESKLTLLIHQTPEGIYNSIIKADTSPSDPRYKVFDLVLCGHIHRKQIISPKFIVGGNPLHRDLGDIGDEKGIWLLDLADPVNTIEFISRKGRYPEFVRVKPEDITEDMHHTSFVVPVMEKQAVLNDNAADHATYNNSLSMEELLINYWKDTTDGQDQRLLQIGLELLK